MAGHPHFLPATFTHPASEYFSAVGRGHVPGVSANEKFGANAAIGTTYEAVWWGDGTGGDYVFPPSEQTMTISSADTDDTIAGSGAQTVTVNYLDGNYIEKDVAVNMNGQTGVQVATDIFRINRAQVLTAGSSDTNEGNIYIGTGSITTGKPAVIYASLPFDSGLGFGQTLQAVYTVPANKNSELLEVSGGVNASKGLDILLQTRVVGGAWNTRYFENTLGQAFDHEFMVPIFVPEKSDIRLMAKISQSGGAVSGSYDMLLLKIP